MSYKSSRSILTWNILENGQASGIKILQHGACPRDDQAAWKAIQSASPFPHPPAGMICPFSIEYTFDSVRPKPLGLTVEQALKKYGPAAGKRLQERFRLAGAPFPPEKTSLVCLKEERTLLVFAADSQQHQKQIACFPMLASSGKIGPKLKEGDLQIPEGFYKPTRLDASTHLCLWVNYPNESDRLHARKEHRSKLGGDIQIHEGVMSTGCVVIDHDNMAELFALAHEIGCRNIDLIMAPCNLTEKDPELSNTQQPAWLHSLYAQLKKSLAAFPMKKGALTRSFHTPPVRT